MASDQARPPASGQRSAAGATTSGQDDPRPLVMNVGQPFPVSVSQLVAFMFRPTVLGHWLAAQASIVLTAGGRCLLPDVGGGARPGRVSTLRSTPELLELVVRDATRTDSMRTTVVRVLPRTGGRHCILRVSETHLDNEQDVRSLLHLWQDALGRLDQLVDDRLWGRDVARQAVVVVHGIGEQLPGQTLRAFVDGILPWGISNVWVKPDRTSQLFELRKVSIEGKRKLNLPTTDIYELYWAHLLRDTTVAQVLRWSLGVLFTRRPRLPKSLRPHLWVLRGLVVVAVVLILASLVAGPSFLPAAIAAAAVPVAAVAGTVWTLLKKGVLVDFVGDAARYLQPRPDNIARRQAIREAGVDLIEALHEGGRYDRIVLFGHSLGSVIAFDILTFAWIRLGHRRVALSETNSAGLLRLEQSLSRPAAPIAGETAETATPQTLQHLAWEEYRRNGFRWLITDFVTAGSPLTHAELLLALDRSTKFTDLKEQRVFPSCPPVTELHDGEPARVRFTYEKPYRDPVTGGAKSVVVPHHAAPFAVTRWTNLFFPFSGLLRGDPIGGPVAPMFGDWVVDEPLTHPGTGVLGFAHASYWSRAATSGRPVRNAQEVRDPEHREDPRYPDHIQKLQHALDLHVARELTDLAESLPLARPDE
jgi:hypothetical protein